eukprot:CAMPEP_0168754196 /NCGR_PEP_ID=MMETSP0724-20121128/19369_1 /TAXON_ID=265536 /ORGANISM="Amphiprora sp., Strain CCMP467" /LENGTH=99 /DNA_ID=CAMNT_0008802653 /DNA_START=33 /DNA_END=329 /DNA_ORIENTATION=+
MSSESVPPEVFARTGQDILRLSKGKELKDFSGRFNSAFGTNSKRCSILWKNLVRRKYIPKETSPKHLLWSLLFMKVYADEVILSSLAQCDAKTFRKWIW